MEIYDRGSAPSRADTWLVYGLVDSNAPEKIRYVGITNDLRRRLSHHFHGRIRDRTRKARWIQSATKHGGDILAIVMLNDLSFDSAKMEEIALIAKLRAEGCGLTNLTDGGDGTQGWKPSDEVKAKIAATRLGKPLPDETRLKISLTNMGRVSPNKGRSLSPSWRENIGAGARKKIQEDPSIRVRVREAGLNRYKDAAAREETAKASHRSGPQKNNKSGFKGVSFDARTKKWVAQIKIQNGMRFLGRYLSKEDAAKAYDMAAFSAWGADCYLNFPD